MDRDQRDWALDTAGKLRAAADLVETGKVTGVVLVCNHEDPASKPAMLLAFRSDVGDMSALVTEADVIHRVLLDNELARRFTKHKPDPVPFQEPVKQTFFSDGK